MSGTGLQITAYQFGRAGGEQAPLDGLAARAGLHPTPIERFVEYGLTEPA